MRKLLVIAALAAMNVCAGHAARAQEAAEQAPAPAEGGYYDPYATAIEQAPEAAADGGPAAVEEEAAPAVAVGDAVEETTNVVVVADPNSAPLVLALVFVALAAGLFIGRRTMTKPIMDGLGAPSPQLDRARPPPSSANTSPPPRRNEALPPPAPTAGPSAVSKWWQRLPRMARLILAVLLSPIPGSLVGAFLLMAYVLMFDRTVEPGSVSLLMGALYFAVVVGVFALLATATLGLLWHTYAVRSGRTRAVDYVMGGALIGALLEIVLTALMPPLGGFAMVVVGYTLCGAGAGATIGIVAWWILRPDTLRAT